MKSKTNFRGFAPILVIILVLLVLVAGVYYFGTIKNKIIPTPSPVASAQPSSSQIAISTPDPATANWKTYEDEESRFSFQYPIEWTQKLNGIYSNVKAKYNPYGTQNDDYWIYTSYENESFESLSQRQNFFSDKQSDIVAGTINGYKTYSYYSCMESCGYVTYITDNHKTVGVEFGPYVQGHTDAQIIKIYNQIVSTFKFIDSNSSIPASWKTYVSQNNNYSFMYPSSWEVGSCDGKTTEILSSGPPNCGSEQWPDIQIFKLTGTEQNQLSGWQKDYNFVQKTLTISGNKCDQVTGTWKSGVENGPRTIILTFVPHDGSLWGIMYEETGSDGQFVYNKILSTFKFTK